MQFSSRVFQRRVYVGRNRVSPSPPLYIDDASLLLCVHTEAGSNKRAYVCNRCRDTRVHTAREGDIEILSLPTRGGASILSGRLFVLRSF